MNFCSRIAGLSLLTLITALGLMAPGRAQTVLSGHYDNYGGGNGYNEDPSGGDYIVAPIATFNTNYNHGLGAYTSGTTTVNGGQFNGNKYDGVYAYSTTLNFNAGQANNDKLGMYLFSSKVTVSGGQFNNDSFAGIEADSNSLVSLYGGRFTSNSADLISVRGASILVYGAFDHHGTLYGTPDGTGYLVGTFTGTLANETTPQTFSYKTYNGGITLVPAPPYTVTDLGTLGGSFYRTVGVNTPGQVAGSTSIGGVTQAFLSIPGGGGIVGLGTTGGGFSTGVGLNNSGQVSGTSQTATGGAHAFLSAAGGGPLKDIGVIPGGDDFSSGAGVNDQGQVTGYARVNGAAHAFLSAVNGGPLKDLGTLPASGSGLDYGPLDFYSEGVAVNNSGQVTGFSYDMRDSDSSDAHAFLSGASGGALKDLGTLGGSASRGLAVNDAGQVTGFAFTAAGNSNATEHAFLSGANGGRLQDLGTLGGQFSAGFAVNNLGQVVGSAELAPDAQGRIADSAFLFSGGKMVDLNTLIAPGSGLVLQDAVGISDRGFITGGAYDAVDGQRHSYLLTRLPAVLTSLTFPSPVPDGTVVTATVSLNAITYSDVVVGLSSSDSSVVRVHRAVMVPAGSSSATFEIDTYRSHVTKTVTIQATLGSVTQTQGLTITGRY